VGWVAVEGVGGLATAAALTAKMPGTDLNGIISFTSKQLDKIKNRHLRPKASKI
jgi:hypothetical protein